MVAIQTGHERTNREHVSDQFDGTNGEQSIATTLRKFNKKLAFFRRK